MRPQNGLPVGVFTPIPKLDPCGDRSEKIRADAETPVTTAGGGSGTKRIARLVIVFATAAIAVAYASAFAPGGAPVWAAWLLGFGIPGALGGIMVLGAAREGRGVGRLALPFAFVIVTLAVGFGLALGLPANEGPASTLWLGLPLRAAIVIYGIGLMPVVVLPVAYALTFETQTLTADDVERVRELGRIRTTDQEAKAARLKDEAESQ